LLTLTVLKAKFQPATKLHVCEAVSGEKACNVRVTEKAVINIIIIIIIKL